MNTPHDTPAPPRARARWHWLAAAALLLAMPAARAAGPYGLADYARVDKIDAHVHVHGPATRLMALAQADGMRLLSINVDYPDFPPLAEQRRDAIALRAAHPGRFAFAASFPATDLLSPGWPQATLASLEQARREGAVGVKIWKNIGMALQEADGRYVMPDDPRLDVLYDWIERSGLVLLGHQAEPRNCWLPLEAMTVRSDREYFTEHPQYYMHLHPEMPTHGQILAARDRALARHPGMRFDSVHLASLEWDVGLVARFLDGHPNAVVDLAARTVHLERQAADDWRRVRGFMIRYQDRILYASDDGWGPADDDPKALAAVHAGWLADWRFLATGARLRSDEFPKAYRGLALPREVIDKIYAGNARRVFPGAFDAPGPKP